MVMPPMGPPMGPPPPDPMMGAPMGPPGMGMGMPMLDPELLLQMGQAVREAMEAQAEQMMQPVYPKWYDPKHYPKPDAGATLVKARQLEAEFAPLRTRMQEEIESARLDWYGHFRDFDQDEDDPWYDTSIQGEIELLAYQIADANVSFDAPAPTVDLRDEAGKKIDFALAAMDHAARLHAETGNGTIELEKARTLLTTGRLAWHCTLNLDADEGEMPFNEYLVDPISCFPVFEGKRGMGMMVRSYQTTLGEAVASFDDDKRSMRKKYLTNPVKTSDGKDTKRLDEGTAVEVVEYWDRRWRMVFINGDLAREPVEHAYGFVPFVYTISALGLPGYMRDLMDRAHSELEAVTTWSHNRDVANPYKGIGIPSLLKKPTRQREAVYARMMQAFKKSMDPPLVAELDDIVYKDGVPDISRSSGDVSPIRKDRQAIQEIPTNPNANVLIPLLQGVQDNGARLMQPPTAHGLNDKSNVSGYATQGLNEAGRIKLVPHLKTLEKFERQCMEMRFRMYRDWGYLIQQGPERPFGILTLPRHEAGPFEDQAFELTPGDLKRAGIRIEVSMSSLPMQMLGPLANAIGMYMQMGLMDEIGALKLLNTQNPYKTLERIRESQMLADPVIQEMQTIERLRDAGLNDYADYFVARKMSEKMMDAMGPPQPDPMMGGSGAMGDSQAAMGAPPGPGSGPPPAEAPVNAPTSPIGTEY